VPLEVQSFDIAASLLPLKPLHVALRASNVPCQLPVLPLRVRLGEVRTGNENGQAAARHISLYPCSGQWRHAMKRHGSLQGLRFSERIKR
jgi:hypothetical protein